MRVLLEIKDSKADFVMELLKNLSFVKAKRLTPAKSRFLAELAEAVEEMRDIKSGKQKGRKAEAFLSEL